MAGLELLGTVIGGVGTMMAGGAAQANANYEAQQLDMKAKEETAAAQREAIEKRREGEILNSRAQAVAAASGGGAGFDAPTIVNIMTKTAGEADYNARTVLYGGESRARGLRDSAKGRRASGKASMLGSVVSGMGQIAGGVGKTVSDAAKAYG